MAGHTPWREVRAGRDNETGVETGRARARAELDREIAAYEAGLSELRKARSLTQVQLAKSLGVGQSQVSRIESQTDLYLSTLQSYLSAMGGRLELVGVFGEGEERVRLSLGDVTEGSAG